MTNAPPVPRAVHTLFEEHRALRDLLSQVESAFTRAAPRAATGPDVVAARLDTLRGPLGAHFDEEERAGLFEEIEAQAPEQSVACSRLRSEHVTLLRRLDELRLANPEDRRSPAWGEAVRALLRDLHGHEERESDLLQRTLDGSTAALD
jgi:hypothetical protein